MATRVKMTGTLQGGDRMSHPKQRGRPDQALDVHLAQKGVGLRHMTRNIVILCGGVKTELGSGVSQATKGQEWISAARLTLF